MRLAPTSTKGGIMRLLRLVALLATLTAASATAAEAGWGAETPNFNLEAILRPAGGSDDGFGLVKFRQPNDAETRIYLDLWVRDLAPHHTYSLQRAVDVSSPNGVCASESGWLTLGSMTTDERGTGRAALSRLVPAVFREFDIHFRVIDAGTSAVVLESGCYQYTVRQ
jgi:hypothetical protein